MKLAPTLKNMQALTTMFITNL